MTSESVVGIVGCGNMGEAIAAGLVASGRDPGEVIASHPRTLRRAQLEGTHRIRTTASNTEAVREASLVLLAVKPQMLGAVLPEIAAAASGKLVVSLCAGTPLATLESALPGSRLVRAMPNQPASVRAGLTALFAAPSATRADCERTAALFESVGAAVWLPREDLFHAVTALSASGPAFVYAFAEALADGGVAAGLPRALALQLTAHTLAGAGRTLVVSSEHPAALKDKVASPGGTTIHGLAALERSAVRGGVIDAVTAAAARSRELAGEPARPARAARKKGPLRAARRSLRSTRSSPTKKSRKKARR